jgi:hypothetical protein
MKDATGNVNLLGGTLETDGIVAGAFTVKVSDKNKATIGTAIIYPLPAVDEDSNGLDDRSEDDAEVTPVPVAEIDGQSAVVKTEAVKDDSKIFVTPGQPVKVGVTKTVAGESFKIEIDEPISDMLTVSWWIVERSDSLTKK